MLANALIDKQRKNQAKKIINLIKNRDGINDVDIKLLEAKLLYFENDQKGAIKKLEKAKEVFKHLRNYEEMEDSWRTRVTSFRVQKLEKLLKSRKNDKALGDHAYKDWLEADKSGRISDYKKIIEQYPKSIYADASTLEIANNYFYKGAYKQCLDIIKKYNFKSTGLYVPSLMLQGDAMLLNGELLSKVSLTYNAAVSALRKPIIKDVVPEKTKALITPSELHALSNSYPVWKTRSKGKVLSLSLDQRLIAYFRYRLLIRVSAISYSLGNSNKAIALAESLLMFDDVDRTLASNNDGAGGAILASIWRKNEFFFSFKNLAHARKNVRAVIFIGLAFYQVYDWKASNFWFGSALKNKSLRKGITLDAVNVYYAAAQKMLRDYEGALKTCERVEIRRGLVTDVSYRARRLEFAMHTVSRRADFKAGMESMQKVLDNSPPKSDFYQQALYFQAHMAMFVDLNLSKRLASRHLSLYPDLFSECMNEILNELKLKELK